MTDDVKEEIDEMIKVLDAPVIEEPPADPPKEEIKEEVKEEPKAEVKEEVKPEVEPEPVIEPEPVKEEPKPEPDERDKTIADLQAKIAEYETKKAEPKPEPKKEEPKFEDQDFLGEVDLDELTRTPSELNKVLNKIYQKAVLDTRAGIMQTLPEVVKENITVMNELQETSKVFYAENEDLKPFKKVVAVVFGELMEKNPDKTYGDLIKDVGPEVRNRLGLSKPTTKKEEPKPTPPRLPKTGTRAGQVSDKPTVEPLQVELEAMNKVIGR